MIICVREPENKSTVSVYNRCVPSHLIFGSLFSRRFPSYHSSSCSPPLTLLMSVYWVFFLLSLVIVYLSLLTANLELRSCSYMHSNHLQQYLKHGQCFESFQEYGYEHRTRWLFNTCAGWLNRRHKGTRGILNSFCRLFHGMSGHSWSL